MPAPSAEIIQLLAAFAPAFTAPTFAHACVLVYGTLLATGWRTVAAALRAVGRADDPGAHATEVERGVEVPVEAVRRNEPLQRDEHGPVQGARLRWSQHRNSPQHEQGVDAPVGRGDVQQFGLFPAIAPIRA